MKDLTEPIPPADADRYRYEICSTQTRELEELGEFQGLAEQELAAIRRLARGEGQAVDVIRAWRIYAIAGLTDHAEELRRGAFGPEGGT